jgi:hypothetical protein
MDVFEYARLRELYGKVYAPREEEVVGEEVQEESPEELDEFFRVLKKGESIKDADARTKAANEKAAKTRDKVLPYSGPNARTELAKIQKDASAKRKEEKYKAGGGDAKVKEFTDKGYTQGQARRATMNQGGTNQRNAKKKANDPNTKALQSLIKDPKTAETKTKPAETKTKPPAETKTKPPVETKTKPQSAPPAPAKNRMASASKADRSAAWAKANPSLANKKKTANPLMKKMGLSKPAAPKPETKPAPTAKPSPAAPAPAAKPMSRIAKATSNVKPFKPMKEEFDIIYDHLVESGFGPDEALKIMVEMPAEKRQQILEKELSIEDQMRISREHNRKSPEEKKEANKKAMGDRPKAEPKKDERTDAEKMADATGPRKGSNYRGD